MSWVGALALAASATGCVVDEDVDDDPVAVEADALKRGKVIVGIADSDPDTFQGAAWSDLGVAFARRVIPWNVALLPKTCAVRQGFDAYLANARAVNARVVIMFGPDPGGDPRACPVNAGANDRAPAVAIFRTAMNEFAREYPKQTMLAAWNEPDYTSGPIVEDVGAQLRRLPGRAADYYVALRRACRGCLLLAGEFASDPSNEGDYWEPYRKRIAASDVPAPKVWSIHPTRDLVLFAADAADALDGKRRGEGKRCDAREMKGCVTKTFATWVAKLPGNATVWLTETEAPVFRPEEVHLARSFNALTPAKREHIQANAVRFLFDQVVKSHANVTRVFIYPLRERPNKRNDSGLVDGAHRREAYGVVKRYVD